MTYQERIHPVTPILGEGFVITPFRRWDGSALIVFEGGDGTVKAQRRKVNEVFNWRSDRAGERHGNGILCKIGEED